MRIYFSSGQKNRGIRGYSLSASSHADSRIPPWTFRLGKPLNGGIFLGVCYVLPFVHFLSRAPPPTVPPESFPFQVT